MSQLSVHRSEHCGREAALDRPQRRTALQMPPLLRAFQTVQSSQESHAHALRRESKKVGNRRGRECLRYLRTTFVLLPALSPPPPQFFFQLLFLSSSSFNFFFWFVFFCFFFFCFFFFCFFFLCAFFFCLFYFFCFCFLLLLLLLLLLLVLLLLLFLSFFINYFFSSSILCVSSIPSLTSSLFPYTQTPFFLSPSFPPPPSCVQAYKCSQCGKGASTPSNLKRHMLTHRERLKCVQCAYSTTDPASLKQHQLTHGTFKCGICQFSTNEVCLHHRLIARSAQGGVFAVRSVGLLYCNVIIPKYNHLHAKSRRYERLQ